MNQLFDEIQHEVDRARRLYPGTLHLSMKFGQAAGAVMGEALKRARGIGTQAALKKEVIQCIAMGIRLIEEGDAAW